jgi:hypothetical protein
MALGELAFNLLQDLATIESKPESGLSKLNLFSIVRMLETAIINIERIHVIWDSVVVHLDCLANSKFPEIRVLAVECFSCLTTCTLMFKAKGLEGKKESIRFWSDGIWEKSIWSTVISYLKSNHNDTSYTMLTLLPSIFFVLLYTTT